MISVIPEHVLYAKGLSCQAKLLFAALTMGHTLAQAYAEFAVLQATASKWFKELEEAGLVKEEGTGTGKRMVLTMDREPFVPVEAGPKREKKQLLDVVWGKEKFDEFIKQVFKVYPRRRGRLVTKTEAAEWIRQNVHENMTMTVLESVRNYAASDEAQRGYACDPIRFFRNARWKDYVGAPEQQEVRHKPIL